MNNDTSAILPANKVVEKDSEQQLATPAIPIHPVPVIPCICYTKLTKNRVNCENSGIYIN